MKLSSLNIRSTKQAYDAILQINSTAAGAAIMKDKAVFKVVKLTDVDCRAANILKQTFLSKGGEAAVSRSCADLSAPKSDVLIMATVHQYKQAIPVLKMQPWKLKEAARLLEQMIQNAEQSHKEGISMQKYKAVIFDLDGTLVNSIDDLADSANAVLSEYGFPTHDTESYKYRVGNGIRKLMQRALPPDKENLLDEALDRFKQIYAKHNLDKTAPYPGIKELLLALKEKQIPIAICTNKHDEAAKQIVKLLFGSIQFDQIIGDKPGLKRKPDPGKVLAIAEKWHIKPNEIAYLGDSGVDMQTAVNADMLPVGVLWGFRKEDELLNSGAKVLIKSPLELLKKISF